MPSNIQLNRSQLAQKWGCNVRTITRWKKDGAPLGDDAAMQHWLATRKHAPSGTLGMLELAGTEPRTEATPPRTENTGDAVATGATAALRRLEAAEAAAFTELQEAIAGGNPLRIKLARDGWLRISESLRKYDLAVEQSRRDSGELVSRAEVEKFAHNLVKHFKSAIVMAANTDAKELEKSEAAIICEHLKLRLVDSVVSGFASMASANSPSKLPEWLVEAALKPLRSSYTGIDECIARHAARIAASETETVPTAADNPLVRGFIKGLNRSNSDSPTQ
jgi:hypothetical protein